MKIQKKKWGGRGSGVGLGGQSGYERRSEVFVKIEKKKDIFFFLGGGGVGRGVRSGGGVGDGGSKVWGRWVMWVMGMLTMNKSIDKCK